MRLELDLAAIDPPAIDPPPGVEIVTWAERPELARGLYVVHSEASRDIPGEEDQPVESFEDWLENDMSGPGDKPEATFVALVAARSSATRSSRSPTRSRRSRSTTSRASSARGAAAGSPAH